ncbi:winged helix-turn-helix transcriptional regulator [Amycolatopsis lurida]
MGPAVSGVVMVVPVADRGQFDAVERQPEAGFGEGTLRFNELHAAAEGISHKMLTQTLRGLERDGVVRRRVHPTVPPRVDYSLTEAGQALRGTINGLCGWTRRYLEQIEAVRARFG